MATSADPDSDYLNLQDAEDTVAGQIGSSSAHGQKTPGIRTHSSDARVPDPIHEVKQPLHPQWAEKLMGVPSTG